MNPCGSARDMLGVVWLLRRLLVGIRVQQALNHRQGEGRGLARSGRRLDEQIAPAEHDRNRCLLDRRGFFVAERRHGGGEFIRESQQGESRRRCAIARGRHPTILPRVGASCRKWASTGTGPTESGVAGKMARRAARGRIDRLLLSRPAAACQRAVRTTGADGMSDCYARLASRVSTEGEK